MADEDDRAAIVVMRQVVLPPRQEALIRHQVGRRIASQSFGQRLHGALAVHGCPHPADLREARRLRDRSGDLRFLHFEVGVVRVLRRHGRIDVETVELRGGGWGRRRSDRGQNRRPSRVVEAELDVHGSPTCPGRQSHTVPDGVPERTAAAARAPGATTVPSAPRTTTPHRARQAGRRRVIGAGLLLHEPRRPPGCPGPGSRRPGDSPTPGRAWPRRGGVGHPGPRWG